MNGFDVCGHCTSSKRETLNKSLRKSRKIHKSGAIIIVRQEPHLNISSIVMPNESIVATHRGERGNNKDKYG
jgi:hypothetical protein